MSSGSNLLSSFKKFTENLLDRIKRGDVEKLEECKKEFADDLSRLSVAKCGELSSVAEWFEEIINALISNGFALVVFEAKLSGVGLADTSGGIIRGVFEVGLAWDMLRDLPYFPASGIKGCFRAVLTRRCAEVGDEDGRLKCLEKVSELLGWVSSPSRSEVSELARLLGVSEGEIRELGKHAHGLSHVVFIDSYPIECPKGSGLVRPWVITPHYAGDVNDEYDVQPRPILHVVLSEGTTFKFVVGVDERGLRIAGELLDLIRPGVAAGGGKARGLLLIASALRAALESGLGARTAKGYGSFVIKRVLFSAGDTA